MEFEFLIDSKLYKISLEKKGDIFVVRDGERTLEADIHHISPNAVNILIEGRSFQVYFAGDEEKRYLSLGGQQFIVQEPAESDEGYEEGELKPREDKLVITAPMPGKVIKINVTEKEEIRRNQTLAIVEAMKMENELKSSIDGYVKKIFVSTGELVDSERPLIELGLKK